MVGLMLLAVAGLNPAAAAEVEIAVVMPLTGDGAPSFGLATMQGIQLAVDDFNAAGTGNSIRLTVYDDRTDPAVSAQHAETIATSGAVLVLGPSFSSAALATGPVFGAAGIASICPTGTSDAITANPTTYRMIFRNREQGQLLALYLQRVLQQTSARVIFAEDAYGDTLRVGFAEMAAELGIDATYSGYNTIDEARSIAEAAAADPASPPIVLLMLDTDASLVVPILRRGGAEGPMLGADGLGLDAFAERMADLPEEIAQPGYFSEGLYALSPLIIDSANTETLQFAERFAARFGHEPSWMAVAGYDAGRLAIAAVRAVAGMIESGEPLAAQRAEILAFLNSLDAPSDSVDGLLGPIWFDGERGGTRAIRVGQFHAGHFESAPIQFVPAPLHDEDDLRTGEVFEAGTLGPLRLQRVVYTGMFLNEVRRMDVVSSTFEADLFVWLRYAPDGGPGSPNPADITFPTMVEAAAFDATRPDELRVTPDGLVYGLWRIHGEFRNDFDFRRFPFDRQHLALPFFNNDASLDQIVYVIDGESARGDDGSIDRDDTATLDAFRNLTQWSVLDVSQQRENSRIRSVLGDPQRIGTDYREESGFVISVDLERRTIATVAKTLLPLFLVGLIMLASLFFPRTLVREKVTVAVTAALSAAVLLSSVNAQLGDIGYTVAAEYAFFLFFALALLCIVTVVITERLHHTSFSRKGHYVTRVELGSQIIYVGASTLMAAIALWMFVTR